MSGKRAADGQKRHGRFDHCRRSDAGLHFCPLARQSCSMQSGRLLASDPFGPGLPTRSKGSDPKLVLSVTVARPRRICTVFRVLIALVENGLLSEKKAKCNYPSRVCSPRAWG